MVNGNVDRNGIELKRRDVVKSLAGVATASALGIGAVGTASAARDGVLLQYYHTDWSDLEESLPNVADAGFTAVQVPPPQESKLTREDQGDAHDDYGEDYPYHPPLGFQPVDRTSFDSAFGTEAEFRSMIQAAHDEGLDVIVDAVLNHMATGLSFDNFPNFRYEDFYHEGGIETWMYWYREDDERCNDPNEWECDPYMIEHGDLVGLPSLNLESEYVRGVLYRYVEKIADCGADGLRWDAAKHMPEWFFEQHAQVWADEFGLYTLGEVPHHPVGYVDQYVQTGMDVSDYPLYYTMEDAFGSDGDFRVLDDADAAYVNNTPGAAITFAANHDSGPPAHEALARAFVLTYEGNPRVYEYNVEMDDEALLDLLSVRRDHLSGTALVRYVDQDYLVFERENTGLVCINKSDEWRGETVDTSWSDRSLRDYTGNANDAAVDADGAVTPWTPPQGYSVFVPGASGDGALQSGVYRIEPAHSGKALDVAGYSAENGGTIQQWGYWGNENQRFRVESVGDGEYRIVSEYSGKVLDVDGWSTADGADVHQWDWWGNANQRWRIEPLGGGEFRVESVHSGKVLDVNRSSEEDGANVQQWTWHGGDNQRFYFRPL